MTLPDTRRPALFLNEERYTLRNFSEEGIGIWLNGAAPFGLTPGTRVSGDIVIGHHIHPVQLEVAHGSGHFAGLRILHRSEELARIFHELLEPVHHASTLQPDPSSGSEDRETGYRKLWYRGPSGNELVVWYTDPNRMIAALQLRWLGKWVYREQFKPPSTGHIADPTPALEGKRLSSSQMLLSHPEADGQILSQAAQVLAAVPFPLAGHLLWQFLETGEQVYLPLEPNPTQRVA